MVTRINGDFDNNPRYTQGVDSDNQDEKKIMRDMRAAHMRRQPDCFLPCGRKKKKEHFSVFRAGKEFVKGLFRPIEAMLKHPIIAAGSLIGLGLLTSVAPITIPILTVLGFGLGVNQMLAGIIKAAVNYHLGDYKDAEKAFGDIAEGSVAIGGTSVAMKTAGSIAAEAKTTAAALKNAESAGDKIAAVEQGVDAGVKVQQGSWANAFKQTHSVITSPRAIWNQLNPRTLFNTGLDKGRSLVAMFRNEPVLSRATLNNAEKTAQDHLGISNEEMPQSIPSRNLNVLDENHNLVESDIRYGVDANSGMMATHHNQAFYSPIDDRLHIEANGFQHAKNAVSRFPFLQKLMDSSPKSIQNFLGNLALKRVSPERLFTQELSKKRQLQSLKHLSAEDYGAAYQEVYAPELQQLPPKNSTTAQSQEAKKVFINMLKAEKAGLKRDPDSTLAKGRGLLPHISSPIEVTARNDANALFKRQILDHLRNADSNYKADASSALRDAREYAVEKRLNEGLKEWNDIAASDVSRKNRKLKRVESKFQATRNLFGTNSPTADLLKADQMARSEYAFQQKTRGQSGEGFQGDLPDQHNHAPMQGEFHQSPYEQPHPTTQDEAFYRSEAPAETPENPTVDEVITDWTKAPTATELQGDTAVEVPSSKVSEHQGVTDQANPKPLNINKNPRGGSGQPQGSVPTTPQTPSPTQLEPTTPPDLNAEEQTSSNPSSKEVVPDTPEDADWADVLLNADGARTEDVKSINSSGTSSPSKSKNTPKAGEMQSSASTQKHGNGSLAAGRSSNASDSDAESVAFEELIDPDEELDIYSAPPSQAGDLSDREVDFLSDEEFDDLPAFPNGKKAGSTQGHSGQGSNNAANSSPEMSFVMPEITIEPSNTNGRAKNGKLPKSQSNPSDHQ